VQTTWEVRQRRLCKLRERLKVEKKLSFFFSRFFGKQLSAKFDLIDSRFDYRTSMSKLSFVLLVIGWAATVHAQSSLSCDKSNEHATLLASCGRMALVWNEKDDRFDTLADSLGAECDDASATQYCSRLRVATGKVFVKGVVDRTGSLVPPAPSQVWLWACTDVARSFNCTQVKGSYIDCWFSATDAAPKLPFGTCSRPRTNSAGVIFQASLSNTPPNTPASFQSPCKQNTMGHYCAGPDTLVFCTRATPSIFYNCPCLVQPGGTADKCDVTPSATSAPATTTMAVPTTTTTTTTTPTTTTPTSRQASMMVATTGEGITATLAPTVADSTRTGVSVTTTAAPVVGATSRPTTASLDDIRSAPPQDDATVPIAVGVSVALCLLLVAIVAVVCWLKKRSTQFRKHGDDTVGGEIDLAPQPQSRPIENRYSGAYVSTYQTILGTAGCPQG
jgi:hypothetical protein